MKAEANADPIQETVKRQPQSANAADQGVLVVCVLALVRGMDDRELLECVDCEKANDHCGHWFRDAQVILDNDAKELGQNVKKYKPD